jgi:hypothetical protein
MKISLNGMIYEETQKSSERGFRNSSSNNKDAFQKSRLYVIQKNKNTANEFSRLILNEFLVESSNEITRRKFNNVHDYTDLPSRDIKYNLKSSSDKEEISAVNFLNEYWA